ncbi:hypothetical protein K437DRAFT_256439, partial [Tilletiaria anomala UBC 951]
MGKKGGGHVAARVRRAQANKRSSHATLEGASGGAGVIINGTAKHSAAAAAAVTTNHCTCCSPDISGGDYASNLLRPDGDVGSSSYDPRTRVPRVLASLQPASSWPPRSADPVGPELVTRTLYVMRRLYVKHQDPALEGAHDELRLSVEREASPATSAAAGIAGSKGSGAGAAGARAAKRKGKGKATADDAKADSTAAATAAAANALAATLDGTSPDADLIFDAFKNRNFDSFMQHLTTSVVLTLPPLSSTLGDMNTPPAGKGASKASNSKLDHLPARERASIQQMSVVARKFYRAEIEPLLLAEGLRGGEDGYESFFSIVWEVFGPQDGDEYESEAMAMVGEDADNHQQHGSAGGNDARRVRTHSERAIEAAENTVLKRIERLKRDKELRKQQALEQQETVNGNGKVSSPSAAGTAGPSPSSTLASAAWSQQLHSTSSSSSLSTPHSSQPLTSALSPFSPALAVIHSESQATQSSSSSSSSKGATPLGPAAAALEGAKARNEEKPANLAVTVQHASEVVRRAQVATPPMKIAAASASAKSNTPQQPPSCSTATTSSPTDDDEYDDEAWEAVRSHASPLSSVTSLSPSHSLLHANSHPQSRSQPRLQNRQRSSHQASSDVDDESDLDSYYDDENEEEDEEDESFSSAEDEEARNEAGGGRVPSLTATTFRTVLETYKDLMQLYVAFDAPFDAFIDDLCVVGSGELTPREGARAASKTAGKKMAQNGPTGTQPKDAEDRAAQKQVRRVNAARTCIDVRFEDLLPATAPATSISPVVHFFIAYLQVCYQPLVTLSKRLRLHPPLLEEDEDEVRLLKRDFLDMLDKRGTDGAMRRFESVVRQKGGEDGWKVYENYWLSQWLKRSQSKENQRRRTVKHGGGTGMQDSSGTTPRAGAAADDASGGTASTSRSSSFSSAPGSTSQSDVRRKIAASRRQHSQTKGAAERMDPWRSSSGLMRSFNWAASTGASSNRSQRSSSPVGSLQGTHTCTDSIDAPPALADAANLYEV